jgi:catechol 2,3-dioxygenase-like lactoylglutathione lyase family enzyme|tara:strand:- start:576 stop:998 length:423 start_codon:yes stop_codon:yes gene_type:complete
MLNIRHTGIVVTDMQRSIAFYKSLGFEIKKDMIESGPYIDSLLSIDNGEVNTVKMSLRDGGMVELLHFKNHQEMPTPGRLTNIGCTHFAMTVDNLEKTYNDLVLTGVEFVSEPQYSPDGFARVVFCKDPDGTFIELVEEI